jgi:hypothetical protein
MRAFNMGTSLRRHSSIILLLAGIGLITLAAYSCQRSQPSGISNANTTSSASPAPAQALPPWPGGLVALTAYPQITRKFLIISVICG